MSTLEESQDLPESLVELLDGLDASTLRAVRTHVEQRLDELRLPLREQIRSETDGEIVDIEDQGVYTLVRKYSPSQEHTETDRQPLSLYRVKREERPDGEETLHWSYLGDVIEPVKSERGTPSEE